MSRLEAVVVCVDYADYLDQTLPCLIPQVHHAVVVTTPEDRRTQDVCRRWSVECLETSCFFDDGAAFNKARGINHGLAHLRQDGWVLHLDADIALPPRTRYMLDNVGLDPRTLYGCDRVNCVGRAAWDEFRSRPWAHHEWRCLIHAPGPWPLGSRIAHMGRGGYCPIGFFQLWNPRGSGVTRYPERNQDTAEHSDVLFALKWGRPDRVLLPEVIAVHLETKRKGDDRSMGHNWSGRTTPEFNLLETPYPVSRRVPPPAPSPQPPPRPDAYGAPR